MSRATTTVLGVTYPGLPMHNSLALDLYCYEQQGKAKEAQALLDAHNMIRRAWGQPPVDLAAQFSVHASSVVTQCAPALGCLEAQERPINRVVERTAAGRKAA